MDSSVASAVAERAKQLADTRVGLVVLAIDGPAGAGKTVLAGQVAQILDGSVVVSMDDLYPGWDGLAEGSNRLVSEVLVPLRTKGNATYRRWDWLLGREGDVVRVPACPVVIVEGVGSAPAAADELIDLIVWVDAEAQIRRRRAIERDGEAFEARWDAWAAQESVAFSRERTMERAHALVRTDGEAAIDWRA